MCSFTKELNDAAWTRAVFSSLNKDRYNSSVSIPSNSRGEADIPSSIKDVIVNIPSPREKINAPSLHFPLETFRRLCHKVGAGGNVFALSDEGQLREPPCHEVNNLLRFGPRELLHAFHTNG